MSAKVGLAAAALVGTALLLVGCAEAPLADIEAAKAAMEAATKAEAREYLGEQHAAVEKALAEALDEVRKQDRSFAPFRKYERAQRLLRTTTERAKGLASAAQNARLAVKTEVEGLLASARESLARARKQLARASRALSRAVPAMKGELASAESTLASAQAMIEAGSYREAKGALISASRQIEAVSRRLRAGK